MNKDLQATVIVAAAMQSLIGLQMGCSTPSAAGGPGASAFAPDLVAPATGPVVRACVFAWNEIDPRVYGNNGALPDCEMDADLAAGWWRDAGIPTAVLKTRMATKDRITNILAAAIDGMGPDDLLIVNTSGHGAQMDDQNGDEADGLDEYICAYDGPILDDDIHEWLDDRTCKIAWICDTCNAGTMGRAVEFRKPALRGFLGQMILIAGCNEGETSDSTGAGGRLHLALDEFGPTDTTWREWYQQASEKVRTGSYGMQVPIWTEYGGVTDAFRNESVLP